METIHSIFHIFIINDVVALSEYFPHFSFIGGVSQIEHKHKTETNQVAVVIGL